MKCILILFLYSFCVLYAGYATGAETKTIPVAAVKQRKAFSYTMTKVKKESLYTIFNMTYPTPVEKSIAGQDTVHALYYLPNSIKSGKTAEKSSAVICMHILGGDQGLTQLICSYLASLGIPALMPYMPGYGPRNKNGWKRKMEASASAPFSVLRAVDQGTSEISRAYDILASRPEVDKNMISLEGISLGAMFTTIAGGKDKRFHKLIILLGGGGLDKIIGNSHESKWLRRKIDALPAKERSDFDAYMRKLDPLTYAPGLSEKAERGKIMMINAECDEVMPPECSRRLAAKMNMSDKLEWIKGCGHYTAIAELPRILDRIASFVTDGKLKKRKIKKRRVVAKKRTLQNIFIQNILTLLDDNIQKNCCRIVDLRLNVGKRRGTVKLIRGSDERFCLNVDISKIGKGAMGYGAYPWLLTTKGMVFEGCVEPDRKSRPSNYIDPVSKGYFTILNGFLRMAQAMPQFMDKYVKFEEFENKDGKPVLLIQDKKRKARKVEITFDATRSLPTKIVYDIDRNKGSIVVENWNMKAFATNELFQPPSSPKSFKVRQKNLDRLFASFINFTGDMIE